MELLRRVAVVGIKLVAGNSSQHGTLGYKAEPDIVKRTGRALHKWI